MNPPTHEHYGLYEAIIDATQSEVILFFVIVAVVMAVVVAPLYVAILNDRRKARKDEAAREEARRAHDALKEERAQVNERENRQQMIEVIRENSSVIASLKTTLDHNGASTVKALDRIHTRLDNHENIKKGMATDIAQINAKFDASLKNQAEMASKINKIFVVSSGGKMPQGDGDKGGGR